MVAWIHERFTRLVMRPAPVEPVAISPKAPSQTLKFVGWIPWRKFFLLLTIALIAYGAFNVVRLLGAVTFHEWLIIGRDLILTLVRVLSAVALSTLIAVPIGVWIGSNPKWSRYLMPLTQIAASFPSPLVFPNIAILIFMLHGNLQWGAVILMIFGTIWYILFNVISGASAIPQDLRACTQLTHLKGWQVWRTLWLPGIFPALTTGWITAAGGAWNTSIVAEYVQYQGQTHTATGLGALILDAQNNSNYPVLAAAVLSMALFVVFFNRFVWKRLSALAQERYQLLT